MGYEVETNIPYACGCIAAVLKVRVCGRGLRLRLNAVGGASYHTDFGLCTAHTSPV